MTYLRILIMTALLVASHAQADEQSLVLFGNFRGSLNIIDDPRCGAAYCEEQDDHDGISFRNNASILGLRGSRAHEDKTAYFKYILRAHNDEIFGRGALSTIIYQVGAKGFWGDISIGVGSTPYKATGMALDPFWDTSASARGFDGPSVGFSDLTWGFTKNLIQWNSAQLWGSLNISAAVVVDDSNANAHDMNIGAKKRVGPVDLGLQFLRMSSSHPTAKSLRAGSAVRVWSQWLLSEPLTLGASLERVAYEREASNAADPLQLHYALTLTYKHGVNRWALALGHSSAEEQPYLHGSGGSVGWFHQFMPGVELHVLTSYIQRTDREEARRISALGVTYNYAN